MNSSLKYFYQLFILGNPGGGGNMFLKKMLSIISGMGATLFFLGWLSLLISNIQGQRMPDGYPLDPWWLILGLLLATGILTFLAIAIWPEKKDAISCRPSFLKDTL